MPCPPREVMWQEREIEYCSITRNFLLRFAGRNDAGVGKLFAPAAKKAVEESIETVTSSPV